MSTSAEQAEASWRERSVERRNALEALQQRFPSMDWYFHPWNTLDYCIVAKCWVDERRPLQLSLTYRGPAYWHAATRMAYATLGGPEFVLQSDGIDREPVSAVEQAITALQEDLARVAVGLGRLLEAPSR